MIQYNRICERYTMPGEQNEVIALIDYTESRNYMIYYNPYTSPCSCGPFYNITDAQKTITKHRPTSYALPKKKAVYQIIRLGKDTCRIIPTNRTDKELTDIAGGGGVISDTETLLDIIEQINIECDRRDIEYKII